MSIALQMMLPFVCGVIFSNLNMHGGQGYDGASNMQGELHGVLKSLIIAENECAFYIHCFAHQL